jgi:hypothetical protein
MSGQLIPFYSYDGSYLDHITTKRAERLEQTGRVKVVRHKKGAVNRAILLRGKDEPHVTRLRDHQGQAYSFEQHLPDGHHSWKLRALQGGDSEVNLAPEHVRPIFIRVLLDCLTPTEARG